MRHVITDDTVSSDFLGIPGLVWRLDMQQEGTANPVTTITDRSVSGFHVSGGVSPAYSAAGLNGHPAADFSAGSRYLTNAGFNVLAGLAGATLITVASPGPAGNQVLTYSAGGGMGHQFETSSIFTYSGGISGSVNVGGVPAAEIWTTIFDGSLTGNTNRLKLYRNSTLQTLGSYTGTVPATIPAGNGIDLGRPFGFATAYWLGLFGEALIYNRPLNSGELTTLWAYLTTAWL